MNVDAVRSLCLSFPHATENVQWGNDLVFKVAGKMFAVVALEPGPHAGSFKCSPEAFADLTERPGIVPAPYLARAHWVALEKWTALPDRELAELFRRSYDLVFAGLPKKMQRDIEQAAAAQRAAKPAKKNGRRA